MPARPNRQSVQRYLSEIRESLNAGNATEHTFRPALKTLLETFTGQPVAATNEPKQIACGAPDFVVNVDNVPIGYIEAKDIGVHLEQAATSEQFQRYLTALPNIILTDYLEFQWYKDGEYVQSARLGYYQKGGKLKREPSGPEAFQALFTSFLDAGVPTINTPLELASHLALAAKLLRDAIVKGLIEEDPKMGSLHLQLSGFRQALLHDLDSDAFADMYAQTVCYGLFAAACNHDPAKGRFTRQAAAYDVPETNPFLREMFHFMAGPNLELSIAWAVEQIVALLDKADIDAILKDFGRRTRQEDPVVHFYETFLAAYDPNLRETRGVYYTPEPVVSFIIRSVDAILKRDFAIRDGLASKERVPTRHPSETGEHKVLVLDPATGTGTFLHSLIAMINTEMVAAGQGGMWPSYVSEHLLPRIFGFELLMAPYAVAHMKLGLQLKQSGYRFETGERLRVYLTNSLEQAHDRPDLILFGHLIAQEANEAGRVKTDAPVMVVLGNPPYSGHSENKGPWIRDLMRGKDGTDGSPTADYFRVDGQPLGERNPKWLNDDYVKFFRFAQWRIERTGHGILAFISNHSYLDNPTFRGMRQSLLKAFDEVYILDLHGNAKKKEAAPDGGKDENVFDIQQGVAIGIFVKRQKQNAADALAKVFHADLWGPREVYEKDRKRDEPHLVGGKYRFLWDNSVESVAWEALQPASPAYFFVPQDDTLADEYEQGAKLPEIFPVHSVGIVTARDKLTVHFEKDEVWKTIQRFIQLEPEQARNEFELGPDARDWKVDFAQADLRESGPEQSHLQPVLYRPFDRRWTYYTGHSRGFLCMPRQEVMVHMLHERNLGLLTTRITKDKWDVACANGTIGHKALSAYDITYLFPMYLYLKNGDGVEDLEELAEAEYNARNGIRRKANLAPAFVDGLATRLRLAIIEDGCGDLKKTFGPEDVFHYCYAVLHAPGYRARYAEFLKRDFARVPLTSNRRLFRSLCARGARLVGLHLMQESVESTTTFPVSGENEVTRIDRVDGQGRVYINDRQYFDNVPGHVWDFYIGGYQVCQKWLKDRKGRRLTNDEVSVYQYLTAALGETQEIMGAIDLSIDKSGGWPLK